MNNDTTPSLATRSLPTCSTVETELAAFAQGLLSPLATHRIQSHVRTCAHCQDLVQSFRQFMQSPLLASVPDASEQSATALTALTSSVFWQRWQVRLEQWLDWAFPPLAPEVAYRDAVVMDPRRAAQEQQAAQREQRARQRAREPLLFEQRGSTQVVLHLAKGYVFGRIGDLQGEPRYPVLMTLKGGLSQESILNQPDGTFQFRKIPGATELECQYPTGSVVTFQFPE